MRLFLPLIAALTIFATGARAQNEAAPPATAPTPAPEQAPPAPPSQPSGRPAHIPFKQRFEQANVSHDGRLTPEQAQALPFIAHHFAAIDAGGKGYVTWQDIQAYRAAHHRPHPSPAPGAEPEETQ
jgi:hypothetical protein